MIENINETFKGWRTIILTWLSVGLTYTESVFNLMSSLMAANDPIVSAGGWKAALGVAAAITVKQIITDVIPKRQ